MKRVAHTPDIRKKLQAAAGPDVDVSKHIVFENVALNTNPVRKEHPLYKGAKHSVGYLNAMAAQVNKESLPMQVMHNGETLPIGRVFHGAVVSAPKGPELRTLFWIDPTQAATADLIDTGTIDQVSVSTLAKDATCSTCGWNFLGPDASMDNIWSGICANDHQLGVKGTHVDINDLDQWFEMSLVGRGGATGAFICSPANSVLTNDFRLAASGKAASWLTLSLSSHDLEPIKMTIEELAALLKADLSTFKTEITAKFDALPKPAVVAAPTVESLTAQVATLSAEIVELKKVSVTAPVAATDIASFLLDGSPANALAKKILIMSGDVEAKLPTEAKDVLAFLETKLTALKALPAAGAKALEAAAGTTLLVAGATAPAASSAFKSAR